MIARILVTSNPKFAVTDFSKALREGLEGVAQVSKPTRENGNVRLQIDQTTIEISATSSKLNLVNRDQVLSDSRVWRIDEEVFERHLGYVTLVALGPADKSQMALQLTLSVLTALDHCPNAYLVYWESASHLIPTRAFRNIGSDITDMARIWIGVTVHPIATGGSIGYTRGMGVFGHREIETRNATEPPEELILRLNGLADYLLESGPVIKDGESFGQTADERIRVKYLNRSTFGIVGPVMSLDYSGTRVEKPVDVIPTRSTTDSVAPQSVSAQPAAERDPSNRRWLFLAGATLAGIVLLTIGWFVYPLIASSGGSGNAKDEAIVQGEGTIEDRILAAERLVQSDDSGIASGNSNAAKKLGESFSSALRFECDQHFAAGTPAANSLANAKFNTFCEMHEHSAAFICFIPEYSELEEDAKAQLTELVWRIADQQADFQNLGRVAIAIKGMLLYDSIQTGETGSDPLQVGAEPKLLHEFFQESGAPLEAPRQRRIVRNRQNDQLVQNAPNIPGQQQPDRQKQPEPPRQQPIDQGEPFGAPDERIREPDQRIVQQRPDAQRQMPFEKEKHQVFNRPMPPQANHPGPAAQRDERHGNAEFAVRNRQPNSLAHRWRANDRIEYQGEVDSKLPNSKMEARIRCAVVAHSNERLSTEGQTTIQLLSDQGGLVAQGNQTVAGELTMDATGGIASFHGNGFAPVAGLPVALLPIVEFPEDDANAWQTKTKALIQTVDVRLNQSTTPFKTIRVNYPDVAPAAMNGLRNQVAMRGAHNSEKIVDTRIATETRAYRITHRDADTIEFVCDYRLTSMDRPPSHEIAYEINYTFDRKNGVISRVDLSGQANHKSPRIKMQVPVSLSLKRMTANDLVRESQERELEKEQQALRQKQQQEAQRKRAAQRESELQAEAESWQPDAVVKRLKSQSLTELRSVLNGLAQNKVAAPNPDIAEAIIELLKKKPRQLFLPLTLLEKWIDQDAAEKLREALPEISDTSGFRHAVAVLQKRDIKNLPSYVIECLKKTHLREAAIATLRNFDASSEPEFIKALKPDKDPQSLRALIQWLQLNGSQKAVSKLRAFSRKTRNQTLKDLSQNAIREIKARLDAADK